MEHRDEGERDQGDRKGERERERERELEHERERESEGEHGREREHEREREREGEPAMRRDGRERDSPWPAVIVVLVLASLLGGGGYTYYRYRVMTESVGRAIADAVAVQLVQAIAAPVSGAAVLDLDGVGVDPLDPLLGEARLLLFVATDCPIARRYAPEIARLVGAAEAGGVRCWLVYPDPDTDGDAVRQHQAEFKLAVDALLDPEHVLVTRARAATTPSVALFDAHGELVYHGRIDDRAQDYGKWRERPLHAELAEALEVLRTGSTAFPAPVPAIGCPIQQPRYAPRVVGRVTWTDSIEPLVQRHCYACHVPGGMAPIRLCSHAAVAKRAAQVLDVVERGLMPPWKASSHGLELRDENRLDPRELGLLRQWVAEGAPLGAGPAARAIEPPPRVAVAGTEELVLRMPKPWLLPADGGDRTRSFVLPIGLADERWVRALVVEPSDPAPLHHALLYLDPTGQARARDGADGAAGFQGMIELDADTGYERGGWSPGVVARALPDGTAWSLPAHSDLVLDIHMVPTGKPEPVDVTVRLFLTKEPPQRALHFVRLSIIGIQLPANAPPWTGRDEIVLPRAATLHGVIPHAHQTCRSVRVEATLPGATPTLVLEIPDWDFAWQMHYRLARPLELPAGTKLATSFVYDNSDANPRNPHRPARRVVGGARSIDEMGALWFELGVVRGADEAPIAQHNARHVAESARDIVMQDLRLNLIRRFDFDQDGSLDAREDRELVAWVRGLSADAPEMREAVTYFDADRSGALDATEQAALASFRDEW
jgi:hypothetical protein